jgi:molecular chaperone DnaK
VFSTARDGQKSVHVRIFQGESRKSDENQHLGEVELSDLDTFTRGRLRVEVTFVLDASGILEVHAKEVATGNAQKTRIHLLGGVDGAEIEAMKRRQRALLGVT